MGNRWKHFKTICRHKAVVFRECKACGVLWQGLMLNNLLFLPGQSSEGSQEHLPVSDLKGRGFGTAALV